MKDGKTIAVFLIVASLIFGAAGYTFARQNVLSPTSTEILHQEQLHMLRSEVMQLRVALMACHEELAEVRKQLEKCEKGAEAGENQGKEEKPASEVTPESIK
jgi:uncharacterized protein HemX